MSKNTEFTDTFEYLLFFTLLIFLAEYPDKPKCIKYICLKYTWIRWLFIFGWLYGRKNYQLIFLILFCVFHVLYLLDDYLYKNYENFKNYKDKLSLK
jgi:hypothetical protein